MVVFVLVMALFRSEPSYMNKPVYAGAWAHPDLQSCIRDGMEAAKLLQAQSSTRDVRWACVPMQRRDHL